MIAGAAAVGGGAALAPIIAPVMLGAGVPSGLAVVGHARERDRRLWENLINLPENRKGFIAAPKSKKITGHCS